MILTHSFIKCLSDVLLWVGSQACHGHKETNGMQSLPTQGVYVLPEKDLWANQFPGE